MIRGLIIILLCLFSWRVTAQSANSLYSGAHFLTIAPDARAGALGYAGTSTSADIYSIYWNAAKSVFYDERGGVSFTYSPWMRDLTDDMNLFALSGLYKVDRLQSVGVGFRYFSYGDTYFRDDEGSVTSVNTPYDMSLDFSYARKLGKSFSAGVVLKYIRSNIGKGQNVAGIKSKVANAVAADISLAFEKKIGFLLENSIWRGGLVFANIGSKLKYGGGDDAYLPGDLRLGNSYEMLFADKHRLMIMMELNAYVSPEYKKEEAPDYSGVGGYFHGLGDIRAKDIMGAFAAEYWYNDLLAVRAGYHYGNKDHGHPCWFSTGVGLKYHSMLVDFSYIASVSDNNPMKNSLQFSLGFDLGVFGKKHKQISE